ncbi:hypothetical protein N2152v2_010578 [Parachlorella kessleri]
MDCLDGKQARRTKTSSPLGQLFDHGVMVYGNGFYGVTEANYSVMAVHFFSWIFGSNAWKWRPLALLSSARVTVALQGLPMELASWASWAAGLRLWDMMVALILVLVLSNILPQLHRVFRLSGTKQLEHTTLPPHERGYKTLGQGAAAVHLLQITVMFVLGTALVLLPAPAPGQGRVQVGTFGVLYAWQATRLIMAHMCKEPFVMAAWPLAAIAVQVANAWLHILDPLLVAYAVNVLVVFGYLHYVVTVVGEICAFLDIPCLTIRRKKGAPHVE